MSGGAYTVARPGFAESTRSDPAMFAFAPIPLRLLGVANGWPAPNEVQLQESGVIAGDPKCVIHTRGTGFKNVEWPW